MSWDDLEPTVATAAHDFNSHEQRGDGQAVASALLLGLDLLRDEFFRRVHEDVELNLGRDSMLVPVSKMKGIAQAKREIDLYQVVEAAQEALRCGYIPQESGDWFVQWLARLRLGEAAGGEQAAKRLAAYMEQPPDQRRLAFSLQLERCFREAARAPLVIYQLFPLAVSIVAHAAFGDQQQADQARQRQLAILPAIGECQSCRGTLLKLPEQCQQCGNPMWTYDWLTTA